MTDRSPRDQARRHGRQRHGRQRHGRQRHGRRRRGAAGIACLIAGVAWSAARPAEPLAWQPLPALPDALGVAGPFVGIHAGALIVAGGANFPVAAGEDRWAAPKRWHAATWVLPAAESQPSAWQAAAPLDRPLASGAVASIPQGVVCIGGDDGTAATAEVFLLTWDPAAGTLARRPLPRLPGPLTSAGAAAIGSVVYVAGGQHGPGLATAGAGFLRLDLSGLDRLGPGVPVPGLRWEPLPDVPGGPRSLPVVVAAGGPRPRVHVMSGRRRRDGGAANAIDALVDHHAFDPGDFRADQSGGWHRRADLPRPTMAGSAAPLGARHLIVVSGDDGALWEKTATLRDAHPGFPPFALRHDTVADVWEPLPAPPVHQLATPAVALADGFILVSGEVRPRWRSPATWRVTTGHTVPAATGR
jgi:N-acetylneuraminic acid mutarotase